MGGNKQGYVCLWLFAGMSFKMDEGAWWHSRSRRGAEGVVILAAPLC
jgi:hypothetical protein